MSDTKIKGYLVEAEKIHKIMMRNTGNYLILDEADFQAARQIHWFEWKGEATTRIKGPIENYLGIKGTRKKEAPKFDYRRRWYA